MNLMNFWIFGWATLGIIFCSSDVVRLCFGEKYVLSKEIPFVLALNFYTVGMMNAVWTYKHTMGLFRYGRFLQIITGVLNIIFSIVLGHYWGLFGILFATFIARAMTNLWYDPYAIFIHGFHKSPLQYLKKYIYFIIVLLISAGGCWLSFKLIKGGILARVMEEIVLCSVVTNLVFYIFFRKSEEFITLRKIIKLLIVLLIGGIYGSIWWKFYGDSVGVVSADKVDPNAKKVKIAKEKKKDKDVYNVLLVGTDSRDPDADRGRSDSMMMVSFNKKEGKSTAISFLRDSLVDIDGHGKSRLGHTYAYGGVGLTINTINKTYDLDIQNYITISFDDLVNVIDEIGGVTVFISEEEAAYYRENGMPDIQAGDVTLTGSQALAHARNRTLGNDFERTRRQRSVMYGIYRKIMEKKDPSALLPLINYAVNHVKTNMSVSEMYSMAKDVLSVDDLKMQQTCIPQDGTYTDITYEGMQVLKVDFDANKKKIEQLLY